MSGGFWVRVPEVLWAEVERLVPVPARRFRYPGRRRFEERLCLEGILTVLRWGIPWRALPPERGRPSGKTCWRRLDEWQRAGVWEELHALLLARLRAAGELEWSRAIADSSHVQAKKGAPNGPEPG